MRRIVLAACIILAATAVNSQTLTDIGKVFPATQDLTGLSTPLNRFNSVLYYYANPNREIGKKNKKGTNDQVILINPKSREITTSDILVPEGFFYIGSTELEKDFLALYSNQSEIVLNRSRKDDIHWNPKPLVTYPITPSDAVTCLTSPDGTMMGLLIDKKNNEGNYAGVQVFVFDMSGKALWNGIIPMTDADRRFDKLDYIIDNLGHVHAGVYSYLQKAKAKSDHQLRIYSLCPDSVAVATEPLAFGYLADSRMKFTSDGHLFMAGYYATKPNEKPTAFYGMTYNTKYTRIMFVGNQKLTGYYKSRRKTTPDDEIMNQEYDIRICNMHEMPNGTIVMLGNQELTKDGKNYSGNVVYTVYSKDGEIYGQKLIKKSAMDKGDFGGNFALHGLGIGSFVVDNKVCLLFNDYLGNYINNPEKAPKDKKIKQAEYEMPKTRTTFKGNDLKTGCTVLTVIDNSFDSYPYTRQVVMKAAETKSLFNGMIHAAERYIIIFTKSTKWISAEKLSIRL